MFWQPHPPSWRTSYFYPSRRFIRGSPGIAQAPERDAIRRRLASRQDTPPLALKAACSPIAWPIKIASGILRYGAWLHESHACHNVNKNVAVHCTILVRIRKYREACINVVQLCRQYITDSSIVVVCGQFVGPFPLQTPGVFYRLLRWLFPTPMAENATDDVLIVGVQRDCDCLCLGENKTKKHKRLAKAQQGKEQRKGTVERSSDNKSLAKSREVEITCTEDLAASTKPNSEQSTQSEKTVKIPSTTSMMHQQPMADSALAAYPQRGATPNDCAHAKLAPTTTLNGGHEGANSYRLGPAQQAGASVSTSHPGPKDGDLDWIDLSTSEWDTFLNQPLTADMNSTLANQHPNSSTRMVPRGNSADTTALYDSSASTSDTSHQALGAATPRRPQHSGADFASIIADTTEKDSAVQSARRNNFFSSTDYPASSNAMSSSSPPSTANENKNLNLSLFDTPSTAQSNCSTTPNHFVNPTSIACNNSPPQAPQLQQQKQPVNAFQDQQQQQGYSSTTTFLAANRPPNYQAAPVQFGGSSSVQGQRQQDYPAVVNKALPNSQQLQSPVNSNNSAFFRSSPNGHAHPAMPPPPPQATTQSGINAQQQQLLFNAGARPSAGAGTGAISAPSNFIPNNGHLLTGPGGVQQQQVPSFTPGSHSLPGGLASSSASGGGAVTTGTEHLQNDEVLARKLQEDEYIKGMIRSRHDDEKLAMSLLAKDLSIRQARNSVPPNIAQYPLLQQQQQQQRQAQFPPQSAMQTTVGGGPSNVSMSASEQPAGAVLRNADEVLGKEQGPGGSMMKHPTCWTQCPNCPSEVMRKYHLIDVERGSPEWNVVSQPLFNSGFCVEQVQRIQNETLWQRLCFEKQLMLRDRPSCNEKFLYHTSKAKVAVICEEGLDPRLSRNGLFGSGIYFR